MLGNLIVPIQSPAGLREVLGRGLLGWTLSRPSGAWVDPECVEHTIEVLEFLDADPQRLRTGI